RIDRQGGVERRDRGAQFTVLQQRQAAQTVGLGATGQHGQRAQRRLGGVGGPVGGEQGASGVAVLDVLVGRRAGDGDRRSGDRQRAGSAAPIHEECTRYSV